MRNRMDLDATVAEATQYAIRDGLPMHIARSDKGDEHLRIIADDIWKRFNGTQGYTENLLLLSVIPHPKPKKQIVGE